MSQGTALQKSPLEELVEAGLRAFKELEKLPPKERFAQLVRAGIVDENGRPLHQDGNEDEEIPLRKLRAELGVR